MNPSLIAIRFAEWIAKNGYKVDRKVGDEIYWFKYHKASQMPCGTTGELFWKFEMVDKIENPELWGEWKHPEQLPGETLLINVKDEEDWESKLPTFIQSVRRGNIAYTTGGKGIVPDMKPLFGTLKK